MWYELNIYLVFLNVFSGPMMYATGLPVNVLHCKNLSLTQLFQSVINFFITGKNRQCGDQTINHSVWFNNILNSSEVIVLSCFKILLSKHFLV